MDLHPPIQDLKSVLIMDIVKEILNLPHSVSGRCIATCLTSISPPCIRIGFDLIISGF